VPFYIRASQHPKSRKRKPDRKWHAVAVVPGPKCCQAVQAYAQTRYLCAEAPRLPVAGCDAGTCDCRYRHFDDRRQGPRREEEENGGARKTIGAERRAGRGRRATDSPG